MSEYIILTDSSCDLPATLADSMHIRVVPLSIFADGKQYYNACWGISLHVPEQGASILLPKVQI